MKSFISLFRRRRHTDTISRQVSAIETVPVAPVQVIPPVKNGMISVRDNRIIVTDPEAGGMYASLTIPNDPSVDVTLNGDRVSGQVMMTQQDVVDVTFRDQPTLVQTDLSVSPDNLAVMMKVTIRRGSRYTLENCEPVIKANLRISEQVDSDSPSEEQLGQEILANGYVGTIDRAAIGKLCTDGGEQIVLRGIPAVSSLSATLRALPLPTEYDPLHRKMRLSTVSLGTPVAILEPALPGKCGLDVYGNVIELGQPKGHTPHLGRGVQLVHDYVVAVINGRLEFTDRKIDVVPELVIRHDITPHDGYVEFDGDLVVYGSVLDGSHIRVAGQVTVHGRVCGAKLFSGKNTIVAGNVVSSTILAGQSQELYRDLLVVLKDISTHFERFTSEYQVIIEKVSQGPGALAKIPLIANMLFETRHTHLSGLLDEVCTEFGESLNDIDEKYRELSHYITTKWTGAQRTNIGTPDIDCIQQMISEYVTYLGTNMSIEPAFIRVMNATSSSLQASGNIYLNGSTYSSTVESGDSIVVQGTVRGGFMVAQNTARVRELGTTSGIECSVRVTSRRGKIVIKERHPNTLLEVCGRRDRNLITERNVHFKGDSV